MATSLKTTTRNKATDAITTDLGSTSQLWVWSGTAPAKSSNNFVAPTGTLLALLPLPTTVAAASVNGLWTANAITSQTGIATGTPGYVRTTNRAALSASAVSMSGTTATVTVASGGASLTGAVVYISGFTNAGNNGTFTLTSSTATTLVFTNASGVNETGASATVYVDYSSTDVVTQNSAGVGSGDFNFASQIAAGGTVGVSSWTYQEGNA